MSTQTNLDNIQLINEAAALMIINFLHIFVRIEAPIYYRYIRCPGLRLESIKIY